MEIEDKIQILNDVWIKYLYVFKDKCKNQNKKFKKDQKYAAVIIEPREKEIFELVLYNFMYFLSDEWSLYIIHSINNEKYVKNITKDMGDIYFYCLNTDNLNINEYNQLLVSSTFYDIFHCDTVLIFQLDTVLRKKIPIEMLQYDYIGAPWNEKLIKIGNNVGNGGLSIRKVSTMKSIIDTFKYDGSNEDVFFCKYGWISNLNWAPFDVASKFSVETY